MPDIRPINKEKYGLSKNRFMEVYYHCLQYIEWRSELQTMKDTVKSVEYGKEGKGSLSSGSATESLAIRRMELESKCEVIEQTAIEAGAELYPWILEGVTTQYATFHYLKNAKRMPCERTTYYDRRRKFYYLLSKKI